MHGRREGEESKGLPRQHMCSVAIDSDKSTTDKDLPSPAGSSIPSDRSRSLSPSSDFFLKVDIVQLFDSIFTLTSFRFPSSSVGIRLVLLRYFCNLPY